MGDALIIQDLTVAMLAAIVGGIVAVRLRLPSIVGYMVAGIVVGTYTPGMVGDLERIQLLAEIGVVLLMFGVGVEFSVDQLRRVQRVALTGGLGQVGLTILLGVGVGTLLGWPWAWRLFFGCIIAISSTTVLFKLLMDRGELGSQHGQITTGISLVQDLSTVLIMVLLPALTAGQAGSNPLVEVGWALGRAALFFVLMIFLGGRIFPWLLTRIAQRGSRELFLLATLVLSLGTALLATQGFGLSLAIGAFVAGLVVSESEVHYRILGEILPLRDAFAILFFVSVGMLIDPRFIWDNLGIVLLITAVIVLGKFLVTAAVLWAFAYTRRTILLVAAGLAQIGEFSFILAEQGMQLGVLDNYIYGMTLSGALLSVLATPFLLRGIEPLTELLDRRLPSRSLRPGSEEPEVPGGMRGHVVVCGYGHIAQHLVEAMQELEQSFVVIEQDWMRVQQGRANGAMVIFGDAANQAVLRGAQLDSACVVAITVPDPATQHMILQNVRDICPHVPIISLAQRVEDLPHMYDSGANDVILPNFEGGLEILRQTLLRLGVTGEAIQGYIDTVHSERYAPWQHAEDDAQLLSTLRSAAANLSLQWYQLSSNSRYVDQPIGRLDIRQRTGASIVAIVRGTEVLVNPDATTFLRAGDRLAALGDDAQRQRFVTWLRAGEQDEVAEEQLLLPEVQMPYSSVD
jgi:CPA2 family monovalent cation:H+ antiporter-2